MKVLVVGGTKFIGRRVVEMLSTRGDEVAVVGRGRSEPPDLPECRHLHTARDEFARVAAEVASFAPDAVVDTMALSAADVEAVLPLVGLSSLDVHEAYDLFRHGGGELPVPMDETAPVRGEGYPYRGMSSVVTGRFTG